MSEGRERPTIAELAQKYGGVPSPGVNNCWRFLHNRDCRAWAAECRRLGYEVFDSLDVGGLIVETKE